MPNRILKDSIRTSKKVNALSDFQFRVWAYLITYVDDYGRGSADPELLKGIVFTRRKSVTEGQIEKAIHDLANMGMIRLYEVDGELFLYFPNWSEHQRIRNSKARFPEPENDYSPQLAATRRESPPESESNPNTNPNTKEYTHELLAKFSPQMQEAIERWLQYKSERRESYKPTGLKALITQIEHQIQRSSEESVISLIDLCMASGWKGIIWDRLEKEKSFETSELDKFINDF